MSKSTKYDVKWLERQVQELQRVMLDAQETITRYEKMIDEATPIVSVAYLGSAAYDYIDATEEGCKVGDLVNAPTRYAARNPAVVVQVGGPRAYVGRLNKITEITSR